MPSQGNVGSQTPESRKYHSKSLTRQWAQIIINMTNYRQNLISKIDCSVEQGEVVSGRIKTAYLFAGQGFPVILLHGAGAGAVTWHPSIGAIAKNFCVIVPFRTTAGPNSAFRIPTSEFETPSHLPTFFFSTFTPSAVSSSFPIQHSMLDVRCSMFIFSAPSTPPSRLIPRSPFFHLLIFPTS